MTIQVRIDSGYSKRLINQNTLFLLLTNIFEDYEMMERLYKNEISIRDQKIKEIEERNFQLMEELKKSKGAKNE